MFNNIVDVIIGVLLIVHGFYSLYSSYKGSKTKHWEMPSTTYLPKKIFGKYFDRWHNFHWGMIEIFLGGCIFYLYFLK